MHSHVGPVLVEHLKLMHFHLGLRAQMNMFPFYSTTGWMMFNLLVGGVADWLVGERSVRRQRQPIPATDRLWRLAAEHGVSYLGVGRALPGGLHEGRAAARASSDLSALRGHRLDRIAAAARGVRLGVRRRSSRTCCSGRSRGGTDLCTGFVGPCPLLPVRAGVISGRCLGARVEAYDEDGKPVIGQVGELVITQPMPSMPVGFWNDPDGVRYRESYFDTYPGRLAARRLDRGAARRRLHHLRPLRRHPQPRRRPDGHQRVLPRGRGLR